MGIKSFINKCFGIKTEHTNIKKLSNIERIAKATTLDGKGTKTLLVFKNNRDRTDYIEASFIKYLGKTEKPCYKYQQLFFEETVIKKIYDLKTEAEVLHELDGHRYKDYIFMYEEEGLERTINSISKKKIK